MKISADKIYYNFSQENFSQKELKYSKSQQTV